MKRLTLLTVLLATASAGVAQAQTATLNQAIRQYNDSDYTEAAVGFYEVAAFDRILENRLKAEYYLAQSLSKAGLDRSAAFFFQLVMNQGPQHPYYLKAIERLVQVAENIGDDYVLPLAIVAEYNGEFGNLPPTTLYKINYLYGLAMFRRENVADALSYLDAVPRESSYYAKALYLKGIIKTFQGREGGEKALLDYEEILGLTDTEKMTYWSLKNTQELATLALARTHYTLGNYPESRQWYDKVERYSTYWDVALFENGWAAFLSEDVGTAMGSLHTLHAPQFAGSFQPEALILKGTVYYFACLYDEVKKELATFDEKYKPMAAQVEKILEAHPDEAEHLPLFLSLVATPDAQPEKLPVPVRNYLLDNQRIQGLIGYLNIYDAEINRVKEEKDWKGTNLATEVLGQLEPQRAQNVLVTGRFIRGRLQKLVDAVSNFDGQAEILRFETSKAEKELFEDGVDTKARLAGQKLLRPKLPSDRWEYWGFDGEWWVDELGFYKYTLKSACSEQGAGGGQ